MIAAVSMPQLWTIVFLLVSMTRPSKALGRLHVDGPFFADFTTEHEETIATTDDGDDDDDLSLLIEDFRDPHSRDRGGNGKESLYDKCKAGRLCAGPGKVYPIGHRVGVVVEGEFVVPPLPKSFDKVETTYYDYLNIFWPTNPSIGHFNQFVPQLMLGNVLANSSNSPDYEPQWLQLDTWHIGSQYFMALCRSKFNNNNTTSINKMMADPSIFSSYMSRTSIRRRLRRGRNDCTDWIAKAATGKLIAVEPGEGVYTRFELVQKSQSQPASEHDNNTDEKGVRHSNVDVDIDVDVEWHLTMGVVGDSTRVSSLVVDRPFMGMLEPYNSKSWVEDMYQDVYVGSCLENYGMVSSNNYPSFWRIEVEISLPSESTTVTDRENTIHSQNNSTDSSRRSLVEQRYRDIEDGHDDEHEHQPPFEFWNVWKMDHDYDCDWQPRSLVRSCTGTSQGKQYQTASWEAWLPLQQ
mmetsp:Transcript_23585/g.55857  ORF Transcript_23585/g.55857 Transcript_23585/m.55857 type:complete len:464 (+) Transcript_23585:81-1472(+)